jgi:protein-L-isoaspartate O-methyltransferase
MGGGRVYRDVQGLRAPERLALLEANRVASICLHDHDIRTVLGMGTGSGVFAGAFASLGLDVTGIDIQGPMLDSSENVGDRLGPSSPRRGSGARNEA